MGVKCACVCVCAFPCFLAIASNNLLAFLAFNNLTSKMCMCVCAVAHPYKCFSSRYGERQILNTPLPVGLDLIHTLSLHLRTKRRFLLLPSVEGGVKICISCAPGLRKN